jgi:hypothetical protein
MNSRDHKKLLKEILPPEDMADFRGASLERALAGLRRERRRRRMARFGAAFVVLAGLYAGILFHSRDQHQNGNLVTQVAPRPASPVLASSHVEFIGDEELLAVFTNQPVALIGQPGQQRLVFLGKSDNPPARF